MKQLRELRTKLAAAEAVYNSTPARDAIASAQAKRNVTRIANQIATIEKLEATGTMQSGKGVAFVSRTPRAAARK